MKNFSIKGRLSLFIAASLALAAPLSKAQSSTSSGAQGKTEALWFGQAGFRIKSPQGKMILIDPWITGGPKTPPMYKTDLSAIGPIDVLLVTHAHVDHIGDAPAVAKANNIKLYGPADMVTPLTTLGILPADLGHRFNKTGRANPVSGITVTAVQAAHSSLLVVWKKSCYRQNGISSCW